MTALTRKESKAQFPDGVQVKTYVSGDHASTVAALQGQEFLVITLPAVNPQAHGAEKALIRAAADAGVPYVMPNAYGPDPLNEAMWKSIMAGVPFPKAKHEIETLGTSKWIVLAMGFWYEWSLVGMGAYRFGCDSDTRTMTFFDDGNEKITTSTWDQSGRALAALLALPRLPQDEHDTAPALDHWANKAVYVKSFRVSQRDMFASAKRVTGTTDADWTIVSEDSRARFARAQKQMEDPASRGTAFSTQLYTRIFFPTGEGDHTRNGLANAALGLPEEDIDEATREGFRLHKEGKLIYL